MELIDNINQLWGDDLKKVLTSGGKLNVAASCFSLYAFEALKKELETIEEIRFIFTSPTFTPDKAMDHLPKESSEFHIPKANRENSLYGTEFEIQLRNQLTQRAIAKECADWIRKKATFKSNHSQQPMQSFALVEAQAGNAVYTPLNGFTAVDLGYQRGNATSNFIHKIKEPSQINIYMNLFQQIWEDTEKLEDVTAEIGEHIASVYQENSPESIYFLMIYNLFKAFLAENEQDVLPNDATGYQNTLIWQKLFNYQKDAATGIINKLETYNGCILADSVGLGKTFTALAVIKYYELRNQSVLVLCPKKLTDNWQNYRSNSITNPFSADRPRYDVLCHTDLGRTKGASLGIQLDRINWGNYDLVVIDESHNFRNNDAYKEKETRYQILMNKVIKEGVKTKVLMLSATPVNNRFNDLRNQLALAYEGDSEVFRRKLGTNKSIEEIFRQAQQAFNVWAKQAPEKRTTAGILKALDFEFFKVLDSVTIARSRKHIVTFYDTKDIGSFPKRCKALSYQSPLTHNTNAIDFNKIFEILSKLQLAVYAPIKYVLASRLKKYEALYDTQVAGGKKFTQLDREKSLRALMTTNLLKRLESSVQAFRLTLQALRAKNVTILQKIDAFHLSKGSHESLDCFDNTEMQAFDEEELPMPSFEIEGKIKVDLTDMDLPTWKACLTADLTLIDTLLSAMHDIHATEDAKLQHLKALIADKIANPLNAGNKKVLIFTAFADTANYLYEHLAPHFLTHHQLHSAKVTGSASSLSTLKKGYDFQEILTLFSPHSKDKAKILPQESGEIDLLIGTDCISEGQNLQDCDYVINYDIHWNPVRIIQRFGRVDRIGSRNHHIQLVNYWPDMTLDDYIDLKDRIEAKMVMTDVGGTGDENPLHSEIHDSSYRTEQLRRLKEGEVIEIEDAGNGISITNLGFNDFRMDVLQYKQKAIKLPPTGSHAVVAANPEIGLVPGVIFTLRHLKHNDKGRDNSHAHNPLYPYYLVYINRAGELIGQPSDAKRLLDWVRKACKGWPQPVATVCQLFNQETSDGRNMKSYSDLLGKAIRSMIQVQSEKALDSLFSGHKTTALSNAIQGLNDFELMAFLVIQEEK